MRVKESEEAGLKPNIQKTKIMASGPISSQKIDGEQVETMTDFIFLSSKITADGNCSHKIKIYLLLLSKARARLDSILKSRDIILPTKIHIVRAMAFPVVMYGCESWTTKKAEYQRIHDFIYFLGSKITADGDCSHEIKRRLLLGRKVMTNLDSILKSRDVTLPTKVCLVKAMVFPSSHVWM